MRWHSGKEYMESLEPVAPPTQPLHAPFAPHAAAGDGMASDGEEAGAAAQLVRLAQAEACELRRRLDATGGLLRAAEAEVVAGARRLAARDGEIARLSEQWGAQRGAGGDGRDGSVGATDAASGGGDGRRRQVWQQQQHEMQLAFLNQQVDFLNERCMQLEGADVLRHLLERSWRLMDIDFTLGLARL